MDEEQISRMVAASIAPLQETVDRFISAREAEKAREEQRKKEEADNSLAGRLFKAAENWGKETTPDLAGCSDAVKTWVTNKTKGDPLGGKDLNGPTRLNPHPQKVDPGPATSNDRLTGKSI